MKSVLCFVAVAILLLAAPWDSASSRENPYGYTPVWEGGDDHPWGGEEQHTGDPGTITVSPEPVTMPGYSSVSFLRLDLYLFDLIAPFWMNDGSSTPATGIRSNTLIIIPVTETEAENDTETRTPSTNAAR